MPGHKTQSIHHWAAKHNRIFITTYNLHGTRFHSLGQTEKSPMLQNTGPAIGLEPTRLRGRRFEEVVGIEPCEFFPLYLLFQLPW